MANDIEIVINSDGHSGGAVSTAVVGVVLVMGGLVMIHNGIIVLLVA